MKRKNTFNHNTFTVLSLCITLFLTNLVAFAQDQTALIQEAVSLLNPVYAKIELPNQTITVLKNDSAFIEQLEKTYTLKGLETLPLKETIIYETTNNVRTFSIAAEYETTTELVLIKPASQKLLTTPCKNYDTITQIIEIPSGTKWEKQPTKDHKNDCHLGEAPKDCMTWRLVESPIRYDTIVKIVQRTPDCSGYRLIEIPAEYEGVSKRSIKKPAIILKKETLPIEYQTIKRKILKTPASIKNIEIPPVFEIVADTNWVSIKSPYLKPKPAEYETVTETIEVSKATKKWTLRACPNCCCFVPVDTCFVWCLVEVPAKYETITKTVLKTPASCGELPMKEEKQMQIRKKSILKTPAITRVEVVPAVYEEKTVTIPVLKYHTLKQQVLNIEIIDTIKIYQPQERSVKEEFTVDKKVKVFPNPATKWLTLQSVSPIQMVFIIDISGKVMLSNNYDNANRIELNIQNLANGTYILKIKTADEVLLSKIVKKSFN